MKRIVISRRHFIGGSIAAGLGVYTDMRFIEPRWVRKTRVDVTLPGKHLKKPIRILHLSDLHASERIPIAFTRKAIELGLSLEPDIVCLTGDLISRHIPDRDEYSASLKLLSEYCPCFACAGNHDGGRWVAPQGGYESLAEMRQLLTDSGIPLLFNSSREATINGCNIELIGLGDYWAEDTDPRAAFSSARPASSGPRIILSHDPDSKETLADYSWDLMLCGHTHGGQLSMPLLGTPFAPVRDQGYVYGLNTWKNRLIYTTSGVGNLHGMRLNCRPEVALLNVS